MTFSLSNNCTKNYYNRTLTVQVIVEDVVTWIFLRHSVVLTFTLGSVPYTGLSKYFGAWFCRPYAIPVALGLEDTNESLGLGS